MCFFFCFPPYEKKTHPLHWTHQPIRRIDRETKTSLTPKVPYHTTRHDTTQTLHTPHHKRHAPPPKSPFPDQKPSRLWCATLNTGLHPLIEQPRGGCVMSQHATSPPRPHAPPHRRTLAPSLFRLLVPTQWGFEERAIRRHPMPPGRKTAQPC